MFDKLYQFDGVFQGGVILPPADVEMPDGTAVKFVVIPLEFTPEEREEFEWGNRLAAESARRVDDMLDREDAEEAASARQAATNGAAAVVRGREETQNAAR